MSFGSLSPDNINELFYTVVPSLEYDSWLTIGIESTPQGGQRVLSHLLRLLDDNWISEFNAGKISKSIASLVVHGSL